MSGSDERLSVPKLRRRPRQPFGAEELRVLRLVADTLIPAVDGHPAGSAIKDFESLVGQAAAILDPQFDRLVALLKELAPVAPEQMWDRLRGMNDARNDDFYLLSLVVAAAYLHSPEMTQALGYPVPHQNPAGMFDAAEELESGILDPVIARGPIYVRAD